MKHTERAQLRALLALLGNVAAGGGRLPPGPTTLVAFGVERMSERILQRRLSFVFALDRSRAPPIRRAIVGAFREKARLCPHFSSISATGALLAALDCAATARTDDIIEERRGVPTPTGTEPDGWPGIDASGETASKAEWELWARRIARARGRRWREKELWRTDTAAGAFL